MNLTQPPLSVYYPPSLEPTHAWLRVGFSGKPFSLGGPDSESNPRQAVLNNRQLLWDTLQREFNPYALQPWVIPKQVHGCDVATYSTLDPNIEADGVWLTTPGQAGMILTADCVPVLVIAPTIRQVLLLHAGWRGTHAHIVQKSIEQLMARQPDCSAESLHVVIGPCIQSCCFQVSRDVAEQLATSHQLSLDNDPSWIHWDRHAPDNPRVSLPQLNQIQCQTLGVSQLDVSSQCTRCNPTTLYSYRGGDDGRQGLWAVLLP